MMICENGKRVMAEGKCSYCGKIGLLTKDHILSKYYGGSDDPSNIAIVCWGCNTSKWKLKFNSIEEVRSWMKFRESTKLPARESYEVWKEIVDSILLLSKLPDMKIQQTVLECLRCGHKWIPRIPEVRICASCKSARWDTPRKPKSRLKK